MADPFPAEHVEHPPADASGRAVERFCGASREIRGCALVGPEGVLAASGPAARWGEAARALLDAADEAADAQATHAHVATEEGEVFAVRSGEFAMVAVTSRYTLASLVFADMRTALRSVRSGEARAARAA